MESSHPFATLSSVRFFLNLFYFNFIIIIIIFLLSSRSWHHLHFNLLGGEIPAGIVGVAKFLASGLG